VKKIFRKNQLVITALALMIAVAGYFSYMNNNMEDGQVTAEASADAGTVQDTYDISEEDMLAEQEIFTDEGTGEELALVEGTETAAVDAAQSGDVAQMTDGAADVENPGEAVLTSTTIANLDYAAEMKLNREQIRSKNKESLLEIVNNTTIDESLKQDAVNKMIAMTDIAEREAAAEMLLEAKGFSDVVVSIGGDGTFLRAAAWVGSRETPIFGVNTGHLGYLSDVSVADVSTFVAGLADGNFRIERRSLLQVDTNAGVALANRYALNEVAILKNASASMLAMDTSVDTTMLNTYLGDGLIIATPTGSTAYNLSVGGPILHPACSSFVLSPIAAHSLTMRPLVVPDTVEIAVTTRSERSHTFRISVDGESLSLPIGSTIRLRKADFCVNVVLRAGHNFAGALRNKLMWGADVR
jgi:stage III sporulation protein AH